jgi:hypothetical protein
MSTSQCKCKTLKGIRCSRKGKYDGFCYQHKKCENPIKKKTKASPKKTSGKLRNMSITELKKQENKLKKKFRKLDKDIELAYETNQNSDKFYIQLEIADKKLNKIYREISKRKTKKKTKASPKKTSGK